jgi:hypothetical protein
MRIALVAVAVVVLATVAAGCGGAHSAAPVTHAKSCPITPKLRRDIAAAKREIPRMHRLDEKLKTVHPTGPMPLEYAVNRFLLDVGPLPVNVKGRLMDLGKSAVGLCQDCFNAIEAEEPTAQTRMGRPPCVGR